MLTGLSGKKAAYSCGESAPQAGCHRPGTWSRRHDRGCLLANDTGDHVQQARHDPVQLVHSVLMACCLLCSGPEPWPRPVAGAGATVGLWLPHDWLLKQYLPVIEHIA